jgi:hypothetical protein
MPSKEEIAAQMEAARHERLKEVASDFDQALAEYSQVPPDRYQLDEYRFVNVFLPFFAGDEKLPYPVTTNHWVNVAGGMFRGGMYNEVDIVNDKGEVLFTVPPVADRSNHVPFQSERGQSSIANVVESAKNLANVHPAQSLNYLRTELAARYASMREQGHALEYVRRWNAIFARYGRPLIEVEGVNVTGSTQPKEEKVEFDGFDEL